MKKNKKTAPRADAAMYVLQPLEKGMVFIFGLFVAFIGVFILYSSLFVAIPTAFLFGFLLQKPAAKWVGNRRKHKLLLQFRDFLDCLRGSFSAGKNLTDALADTVTDLEGIYGKDGRIVREVKHIREGMRNGVAPEFLFRDFADRSGLDDIRCFADTVGACIGVGGDMRKTVADCRDVLCDRIAAEQEIAATLSQAKLELYLLCGLPFAATLVMRLLGSDLLQEFTFTGIVVKTLSVGMYVAAFLLAKKITDVKV